MIMIVGARDAVARDQTSSVNIHAGRAFTATRTVILYTGMTPASIAITGIATPGRRRVNAGAAAAGMLVTAATTAGGAIDTTTTAVAVTGGGAAIAIRSNRKFVNSIY
jgi:hypothetical protein